MDRVTRIYPVTPPIPRREQGIFDVLLAFAEGKVDKPLCFHMTEQVWALLGCRLAQESLKAQLVSLADIHFPLSINNDLPEPGWEVEW